MPFKVSNGSKNAIKCICCLRISKTMIMRVGRFKCIRCMLPLLLEQRSFAPYFPQGFTILVGKKCWSTEPIVRSPFKNALGLLIENINPPKSYTPQFDRVDSSRSSQNATYPVHKPPSQQLN